MRPFFHATALNVYIREGKIPRGLQIQKSPGIFQEDDNFKSRWVATLNQCSRDLMLLIIERSREKVTKIKEEIKTIQEGYKSLCHEDQFEKTQTDLGN